MDYLKRLDQSVKNFEQEADKLSKINELIQNTSSLINEVSVEKSTLEKSTIKLVELQKKIMEDCKTLSNFVDNEGSERKKLISDVHETILKDSSQILNDLSKPLHVVKTDLVKNCEQLNKFIETHKKSQEVFLS